MLPKLCITVTAETTAELRERRDAVADADLVEMRLDTVRDPSVPGALAGRRIPVIVTCRSKQEGGFFDGSEEDRRRLLAEALDRGAEYVDLEASANFDSLIGARGGKGIVLSLHDFTGVPTDLTDRIVAMCRSGAEVVKVAVLTRSLGDCLRLADLSRAAGRVPIAVVGLGEAGLATRVLASRFGSCWTYASEGAATAKTGQVSADRLINDLHFRRVFPQTAAYGIVGRPLAHSVSPAMHNAAFQAARLDAVYLPLAAENVDDFFAFARAFDVRGVSVTAPFKVDLYERIDEADPVSRRVGAINTLRMEDGRWVGTNTDVPGFLAPLKGHALEGARVAVLGTGGAARAVMVALASTGARVTVYGRRADRARAVAALADANAQAAPCRDGWDILVNATPVGTFPAVDASPFAGPFTGRLVYDLVYNPPETRLLRDAAAAGCKTISGLDMLVVQAQQQFEWWTGRKLHDRVFREAALAAIRRMASATVDVRGSTFEVRGSNLERRTSNLEPL